MQERIDLLKADIIAQVPQVPFVIDQVGSAIDWCVEVNSEKGDVVKLLECALEVATYIKNTSEPNFYKTHLLIATLIGDIDDVFENSKFDQFRTASGAVEKAIKEIRLDPNTVKERGCFNALNIHLAKLARTNEDYLVLALYGILCDLKEITAGLKKANVKTPITSQDYITVLGYAYVLANLRMTGIIFLDKTQTLINKIAIILNSDIIY